MGARFVIRLGRTSRNIDIESPLDIRVCHPVQSLSMAVNKSGKTIKAGKAKAALSSTKKKLVPASWVNGRPIESGIFTDRSRLELSKQSGISHPHVSKILNGTAKPSLDAASKLAKLLGVTMEEFLKLLSKQRSKQTKRASKAPATVESGSSNSSTSSLSSSSSSSSL